MLTRRHFLTTATSAAAAAAIFPETARAAADAGLPFDYMPQWVTLATDLPANEVHVVPDTFRLYWTQPGGQAIRYTVGIGRPGLYESGEFFVGAKKEWPSWTPTPDMIARQPELYAPYADGMPGGEDNPLGARALYLFQPSRGDTMLRIHGTNQPGTIGTAVSNGCARLVNSHVIDLYNRVPEGARVVLYQPRA